MPEPTWRVGTSGFAYKEWKGPFYPADLPARRMLEYYGQQLNAVEINNTFYRMPTEKVLLDWRATVPDEFRFVLKASRRITHFKRLRDTGKEVDWFARTATVLGDRLGPTLFQLPPNLKKDTARLQTFLATLPAHWLAAFEFRHDSWHDPEIAAILREAGAALVTADTEDQPAPDPVITTSWGYLRLRRSDYTDADLKRWKVRASQAGWDAVWVFFKHEAAGRGPGLARRFREL